eukprot:4911622-Prymnesium_polylepis.1
METLVGAGTGHRAGSPAGGTGYVGSNQGETAGQGQTPRPKIKEYSARLRHGTARRLGGSEA